jgi:hypothetical protein
MVGEFPLSGRDLEPDPLAINLAVLYWILFALVRATATRQLRSILFEDQQLRHTVVGTIDLE